jgi:hypothetical protein
MTDPETATGPLAFAASFPPEERFAATAAEIAARLAAGAGCVSSAAEEVRGAVVAAFCEALAAAGRNGLTIDLTLRTTDGAFDADLTCGRAAVLHCSRPRSA